MLDLDEPRRPYAARLTERGKVHWVAPPPARGTRTEDRAWCGYGANERQPWRREVGDGTATAPVDLVTCRTCLRRIADGNPEFGHGPESDEPLAEPDPEPPTALDVGRPPLTMLLPRENREGSPGRGSWDRLRGSLRTIEREVISMRTQYLTFRRWVVDEASTALEEDELSGLDEPGPRARALLDVIERLPQG